MKRLDRITVTDGGEFADELGGGKLTVCDTRARIYLRGDPEARLPERDVEGLPIVASKDGGVRYTGEVLTVERRTDAPVAERVVLACVPATEH